MSSPLKSPLQKAISGWLAAQPDSSQAALAKASGIDPGDLSRIVRGDKASLNMEPAARLAAAMCVTVEDLLAGRSVPTGANAVRSIALDLIDPSPHNPRKEFDKAELADLAASISVQGLLQPLIVRDMGGKAGRFELIAGERRLRALKLNKATEALCLVRSGEDDGTTRALQIIENMQRRDIAPMEEADAFSELNASNPEKWTFAAIGRAVGKSDRFVSQRVSLSRNLEEGLKQKLAAGDLTVENARVLATAPTKLQKVVAKDPWALRSGPEAVRRKLQDKAIPLSAASFKVELYDGEWLEEGGKKWFADAAKFGRLQTTAAVAKVERLKKDWPTAVLVSTRNLSDWVWADDGGEVYRFYGHNSKTKAKKRKKGLKAEDCNALVYVEKHKIVTLKNVVPRAAFDEKTEKEKPAAMVESQHRGFPLESQVKALDERMQTGLAERPDLAKRLVVYSFLGNVGEITFGDCDLRPLVAPWAELLAEFLTGLDPDDGSFEPSHMPDDAEDKLWTLLAAQDEATIDAMLGRFMSCALVLPRYRPQTGGLHRAIAAAIGFEVPRQLNPAPVVEPPDEGDASNAAAEFTEEASV